MKERDEQGLREAQPMDTLGGGCDRREDLSLSFCPVGDNLEKSPTTRVVDRIYSRKTIIYGVF